MAPSHFRFLYFFLRWDRFLTATDTDQNENEEPKLNVEEEMSAIKSTIIDNWKKLTVRVCHVYICFIRMFYAVRFTCHAQNQDIVLWFLGR